ncbi:MAG: YciI family protein [Luteimonas sp.]
MKTLLFGLTAAIAMATGFVSAQTQAARAAETKSVAAQLPPGMKQYWFVMLKKGVKRDQSAEESDTLQAGHMANIETYAKSGQLQVAGPFTDDGDWRGLFILDVADRAAAEKMCADDPAVAAGRLACEIHPWLSKTGATLK